MGVLKGGSLTKQERAADLRLRREYGITLDQYNLILFYQNNCCAICQTPASHFKTKLAVDHDHITGIIRGLLCMRCNRALGKFLDNDMHVYRAYKYTHVPPAVSAIGTIITAPGRVGTKKRAKLLLKIKQRGNGHQSK